MKDDYFNRFNQVISDEVYQQQSKDKRLIQSIHEEDYEFDLSFIVDSDHAVAFRLEDFKKAAHYLNGHDRAAGKDNDCTVIDDNIYQFEVKYVKHIGNATPKPQFIGGLQWLRHLLWLVAASDDKLLDRISQLAVYNIVIFIPRRNRGMSRHVKGARFEEKGDHFLLTLDSPRVKKVDITAFKQKMGRTRNCVTLTDEPSLI
ncbi:putative protein [Lactobacillus brevis] [Lactiplantibacillus mudanjiangensis]|uniref:hypothetical protein n=1 Tax=Lactiplantibacillus mudanjiangensis TaxID=1296538 RepID=UPI00101477BC|nr:hypothetical protein [Lactiplantibacillus mudanjiangensis]VDG32762.1 putative protein [Lactobacillus brevis] [Lactiplantibacillus mudanjiangensis]